MDRETLQVFVQPYSCSICAPLHRHNWLSFGKFQDTEHFLIHCERHFSSWLPPSGGTCKYTKAPSTKKTWRDPLYIDMLLSAVSVLVVAQSIFEIPEGLMNNPVCLFIWGGIYEMWSKCYKISVFWNVKPYISTLKMEAAGSSVTLLPIHHTTRFHIPEACILEIPLWEPHISHTVVYIQSSVQYFVLVK